MQSTSPANAPLSPTSIGNPPIKAERSSSTSISPSSHSEMGPPAGGAEKEKPPRLTEQEKKNNHIASEQKRRAAIREGFDRLTMLVPGLIGQGRSEGIVLRKTVDYMRLKVQERRDLIREIENRGGVVDDRYRI